MPAAPQLAAPGLLEGHGIVPPAPISLVSEAFSGDVGELFRLVRNHAVDLLRVPLADLAEAYLTYRLERPEATIEESAAALAILAYLAERKAWLLVPRPETEPEEPDEETMRTIAPLPPGFVVVLAALEEGRIERERRFFRAVEPDATTYEIPIRLGEVGPGELARAFERLLRRAPLPEPENLSRPRPDLGATMRELTRRLAPDGLLLDDLFAPERNRSDLVFAFLALLELIRLGRARAVWRDGEVAILP